MAVLQDTSPPLEQRQIDHLRPLDSVLEAMNTSSCTWCQSVLALIRRHLEEYIPVFAEEGRS